MGQVCGVGRGLRRKIKQNKSKFLALSMLGSKLFDIPSYTYINLSEFDGKASTGLELSHLLIQLYGIHTPIYQTDWT